jgi:hypothetical protein
MRASLPRKHCGCWLSGLRPRGAVLQSAPPAELVSSSLLRRTSWTLHAGAQPLISEACMARSRLLIDLPMARGRCRPRTPLDTFTKARSRLWERRLYPAEIHGDGHPCGPAYGPRGTPGDIISAWDWSPLWPSLGPNTGVTCGTRVRGRHVWHVSISDDAQRSTKSDSTLLRRQLGRSPTRHKSDLSSARFMAAFHCTATSRL